MFEVSTVNSVKFFEHPIKTAQSSVESILKDWCFNKNPQIFWRRKSVDSLAAVLALFESILERLYIPMRTDGTASNDRQLVPVPYEWANEYKEWIGWAFLERGADKEIFLQLYNTAWMLFFNPSIYGVEPISGITLLAWKMDDSGVMLDNRYEMPLSGGSLTIEHVNETELCGCHIDEVVYWDLREGTGLIDNALIKFFDARFFATLTVTFLRHNFGNYIEEASSLLRKECIAGIKNHSIYLTDYTPNVDVDGVEGSNSFKIIEKIPDRSTYLPYAFTQVMVSAMKHLAFRTSVTMVFNTIRETCYGRWVYTFDRQTLKPVYVGGWEDWEVEGQYEVSGYQDYVYKYLDGLGFVLRYNKVQYIQDASAMSAEDVLALPLSEDGSYRVRKLGKQIFAYITFEGEPEVFQPLGTPYETVMLDYSYTDKPSYDKCDGIRGWPSNVDRDYVEKIRMTFIDAIDHFDFDGSRETFVDINNEIYRKSEHKKEHYDGFDFSEAAANHTDIMMAVGRSFQVSRPLKKDPDMRQLEELIEERWDDLSLLYSTDPVEGEANYPIAIKSASIHGFDWDPETFEFYSLIEVNYGDFDSGIVFGDSGAEWATVENRGCFGVTSFDFKHLNKYNENAS